MKKLFLYLLIITVLLLVSAPKETLAMEGVAVINIQDIMRDSLAAKSVKKKLEAKQKSFQAEMTKKEKDLQKKERDLVKQRGTLSQVEFDKKAKSFQQAATKAQRDVQTKKAKLDKAFSDSLATIQKTVTDIAKSIAKERGVKLVLPTSQLLYADPSLDITKEVLAQLNKKLPNVKVNF
jgi:Skp family chaperone for outer membrane proteins